MNRFGWYVFKQLFIAMAFAVAALTCIIWLTQSLRVIELIVNRGLSIGMFLYMTALALPNFLEYILLIALFIAVIIVYARMSSDRELVVMRAAGVGQTSLAAPALVMAGLVMGVCFFLTTYLIPTSYNKFRNLQWEVRYNVSHILLREGAFNALNKNVTVYIRERTANSELLGILIYDNRNPERPKVWMAERGAVINTNKGPQVLMFNGSRQEVDRKTNRLSVLHFDRWSMQLNLGSGSGGPRYREPRERYVGELLHPWTDPRVPKFDWGKMIAEGHSRLTWPPLAFGFTLIALSALITGAFDRRGQAKRVTVAVIAIVVTIILALGLQNLTGRMPSIAPLMYVNVLLPILIGGYLTFRSGPLRHRVKPPAVSPAHGFGR